MFDLQSPSRRKLPKVLTVGVRSRLVGTGLEGVSQSANAVPSHDNKVDVVVVVTSTVHTKMADFWTYEREDELVTLWQGRPCLFDISCNEYSHRGEKYRALGVIADQLGTTGKVSSVILPGIIIKSGHLRNHFTVGLAGGGGGQSGGGQSIASSKNLKSAPKNARGNQIPGGGIAPLAPL